MGFFENSFILLKNYLDDCKIKKLDQKSDQKLIILIIYSKIIFLANNVIKKFKLSINKIFYNLMEKIRKLSYSNFFYYSSD